MLMLVMVCLPWSGCAPSMPLSPRPGPSARDPSQEAQARLIQLARSEVGQGHHEAAIRLFRRLLDRYPRSPFLPEAQWGLAGAYDRAGDLRPALTQYRLVVQTAATEDVKRQARSRIGELERLLSARTAPKEAVGLLLPSSRLPAAGDWPRWVHDLAQAGTTLLVIEAWAPSDSSPASVYFRTDRAPTERDLLGPLVGLAHGEGLMVFAAVALRQMPWLAPHLGWNDRTYDPDRREYRSTSFLDLFNPAVQEYLVGLLTDLAASGVDGILFRDVAPPGPADGFSTFALQGFARDFRMPLDPDSLFRFSEPAGSIARPPLGLRLSQGTSDQVREFWRWTGWKAREQLRILDRLKRAVRTASPTVQFALELHREAVTDPVQALVRYGEDLLEAKRSRFDVYVLGVRRPDASSAPRSGALAAPASADGPAIVARMGELIGEPERIWVGVPLPAGRIEPNRERLQAREDLMGAAKRSGLLYVGDSFPVP